MRRYDRFPSEKGNSLLDWYKIKNPLRTALNYIIVRTQRALPSLALKRHLLRAIGMRVADKVAIGIEVNFDFFFPELIEIGENTIIGGQATIIAHEFLPEELRVGKVKIGKNCLIGANSTILCGVEIGDGARIGAGSVVVEDVPPGALVVGVPAKAS